ncbi:MAG: hypothetical protein WA645_11230 [Pseudolabrys sp.]
MKIRKLAYATFVGLAAVAFVIGSAVPSEAAKKKKAAAAASAAPAQQWPTCWGAPYAPVCATKGSQNFGYINPCYAMKDGASKAKARGCKVAKASGKKKKA